MEKLKLSKVPKKSWVHLTVDFITKLPVVARKDAILVVCDWLSKMTHFVATIEGTSAKGLARLFWDNVWKLHGLLESVRQLSLSIFVFCSKPHSPRVDI